MQAMAPPGVASAIRELRTSKSRLPGDTARTTRGDERNPRHVGARGVKKSRSGIDKQARAPAGGWGGVRQSMPATTTTKPPSVPRFACSVNRSFHRASHHPPPSVAGREAGGACVCMATLVGLEPGVNHAPGSKAYPCWRCCGRTGSRSGGILPSSATGPAGDDTLPAGVRCGRWPPMEGERPLCFPRPGWPCRWALARSSLHRRGRERPRPVQRQRRAGTMRRAPPLGGAVPAGRGAVGALVERVSFPGRARPQPGRDRRHGARRTRHIPRGAGRRRRSWCHWSVPLSTMRGAPCSG